MRSEETLATWREVREAGWAVLLIDSIALALGLLADRYVDGARWLGVVLAAWVTVSFAVLVGGNLLLVWLARRWTERRRRRVRPQDGDRSP